MNTPNENAQRIADELEITKALEAMLLDWQQEEDLKLLTVADNDYSWVEEAMEDELEDFNGEW